MAARFNEEAIPVVSRRLEIGSIPVPLPANKCELRVFPDEHSVVDDALLKRTPYIVNTQYMVLICTDCQYCITPDRAPDHLRKDHPHCKLDTNTLSAHLMEKFPGLVAEVIQPPDTIEAVFGLAIPVKKYTVCSCCRRGYANVSTWQRHDCKNADTNKTGQQHFRSHVQTFFRGPRTCYFPVNLPALVSTGTKADDFDLFKAGFQEHAVSDADIHESADFRELNQFLLKEGWIDHVSGFYPNELSLLTSSPAEDEILMSIARDVVALMSTIQAAIGAAGYHVRRLLGRRPAYVFSSIL